MPTKSEKSDSAVKKRKVDSKSPKSSTAAASISGRRPRNASTSIVHVDKEEMAKYVLWRRPIQTLYYFIFELIELIYYYFLKFLNYRKLVVSLILLIALVTVGFNVQGSHLVVLYFLRKKILWCSYWVGLGVASSIGLGTGLHTFLLYLGPFIAQVTLAAYECDTLDFPEPPYPDEIMCPPNSTNDGNLETTTVSLWSIMSKVRLESFMWGAGTALGELPPYFMARASALSSRDNRKGEINIGGNEEELEEFEHLLEAEKNGSVKLNFLDKLRLYVFKIIKKVGFWGILLCASIPNPLFDLAGITCGHFMVKFSTFFGATLIGKAIIKMHIQKLFVIFMFSQHHLDNLFEFISKLPYVGKTVQPLFVEWLNEEKNKLHKSSSGEQSTASHHQPAESILSWVLNKIVLLMVLFFVISIVNSLAQQRYKRLYIMKSNEKSGDSKIH